MRRSISVMIGKGSVNHNCRQFHAKNTDPDRSHLNHTYCNDQIQKVYHELFDEAVKRYNAKQIRSDRCIDDYYQKIRAGKQEKPFHEVILQIGNREDMNAQSEDGQLSVKILGEYMSGFQERNPNLRVFSAHLHMDEATPHLHIDFVPFITGSKRGLDTRVSLKQALAAQGFKGGSRQETEWNQWVAHEKEQLAAVMERHGIEWEQLGTHEKHLSVLNFEKQERTEEVARLGTAISENLTAIDLLKEEKEGLKENVIETEVSLTGVKKRLDQLQKQESLVSLNTDRYDKEPEWQVPEPGTLMSTKTYKTKIIDPFVFKLKDVIRSIVAQYLRLKESVNDLEKKLSRANDSIGGLNDALERKSRENKELKEVVKDYGRVRKVIGEDQIDSILEQVKAEELAKTYPVRFKNYNER
jgi:hypothetical protein